MTRQQEKQNRESGLAAAEVGGVPMHTAAMHPNSPQTTESTVPITSSQDTGETRFIARQPILDSAQQLYGYELLFRSDATISFADIDCENAMHATLDLSLLLGAGSFTEGHLAFINCTRNALCSRVVDTLPKDSVVLEILETVPADQETLRECRRLKAAGYKIALDDIVSTTERLELFELADIIKVDFLLTDTKQQQAIARRFARRGVQLLAEKVETHEQFSAAIKMGYTLFQGYFFCRPKTMEARDLPSTHLGYLEILRLVYQREVDVPALARAIREEPSLCYRLLRYLNSAAWSVHPVNSIVHALNLLGSDEIRKWVSMLTAISMAGPRSKELIRMALIRALFCELVAEHLQLDVTDFFLTGLFSLLEAILDRPLAKIVEHIPISETCRAALTGASNRPGLALRLAVACGRGYWETIPQLCAELGCSEQDAWRWQSEAQSLVRVMLKTKIAGEARSRA
jgi:EAL and modified HD-GYP domain-containing signal transduction protein